MKIVFATKNPGKLHEMRALLADLKVHIVSAEEAGFTADVVEDQSTLEGNAIKKAREVGVATGEWSVSDDSGLLIAALGGAPGVRTRRWAGEDDSDENLIAHTLASMDGVPEGERQAYFQTVVALCSPDGEVVTFSGRVDGEILTEVRGQHKPQLPYDVLFLPEGESRTFGEMSSDEKNAMSHRGRAFQQLKAFLQNRLQS